MSVNKVILVGRLGRDPETRYTGGGQAVCNFSMATDETFKDKSGERQKRTEWHRIVAWGKKAEFAQQYLKKGQEIYVEGSIRIERVDGQGKPEADHASKLLPRISAFWDRNRIPGGSSYRSKFRGGRFIGL